MNYDIVKITKECPNLKFKELRYPANEKFYIIVNIEGYARKLYFSGRLIDFDTVKLLQYIKNNSSQYEPNDLNMDIIAFFHGEDYFKKSDRRKRVDQ